MKYSTYLAEDTSEELAPDSWCAVCVNSNVMGPMVLLGQHYLRRTVVLQSSEGGVGLTSTSLARDAEN